MDQSSFKLKRDKPENEKLFNYEEYQTRKPVFEGEQEEKNTSLRVSKTFENGIPLEEGQEVEENKSRDLTNSPKFVQKKNKSLKPSFINMNDIPTKTFNITDCREEVEQAAKPQKKTGLHHKSDSKYNT